MDAAYVETRLRHWAKWARGRYLPYRTTIESAIQDNRGVLIHGTGARVVEYDRDAEEIERIIVGLDVKYKTIICEHWLRGGTLRQKMAACGIRSKASYYDRLHLAHGSVRRYLD